VNEGEFTMRGGAAKARINEIAQVIGTESSAGIRRCVEPRGKCVSATGVDWRAAGDDAGTNDAGGTIAIPRRRR